MKYIIKTATPNLAMKETQLGTFSYFVTHWSLHVIQWDGICQCTREEKDIELKIHGLSYSKKELVDLIKKGA